MKTRSRARPRDLRDPLAELQSRSGHLQDILAEMDELVAEARLLGASWATLAAVLRMSRQAAWKRYRWLEDRQQTLLPDS